MKWAQVQYSLHTVVCNKLGGTSDFFSSGLSAVVYKPSVLQIWELTRTKQDNCFKAGKLRWIDSDSLKPQQRVVKDANVCSDLAVFAVRHPDRVLRHGEQGTRLQRHAPLNGVQQEQFGPRFLQQDYLKRTV